MAGILDTRYLMPVEGLVFLLIQYPETSIQYLADNSIAFGTKMHLDQNPIIHHSIIPLFQSF